MRGEVDLSEDVGLVMCTDVEERAPDSIREPASSVYKKVFSNLLGGACAVDYVVHGLLDMNLWLLHVTHHIWVRHCFLLFEVNSSRYSCQHTNTAVHDNMR